MAKGKNLILIVVVIIVAVLAGLGGAYFLFGKNNAAAKVPPPPPTVITKLGDIVVNLADDDVPRYLRVGVNVEIEGQGETAAKGFEEKSVIFKDRVITFLRSKKSEDISGAEASQKLKEEMLKVLEETAAELNKKVEKKEEKIKIVNVYFSDFIIQ